MAELIILCSVSVGQTGVHYAGCKTLANPHALQATDLTLQPPGSSRILVWQTAAGQRRCASVLIPISLRVVSFDANENLQDLLLSSHRAGLGFWIL